MEFKRLICPNCGASIDYESGQAEVTCEYCGGRFSTGDKTQSNAEQNGYYFEKGRQRAMMEQQPVYNSSAQQPIKKKSHLWLWVLGWILFFPIPLTVLIWKSPKLDNKWKAGLTIALWGGFLLWGRLRGTRPINQNNTDISLSFSAFELKNKNYSDVKTKFESLGFNNIVMEPIETDDTSLIGKVYEVSLNGDTNFIEFNRYPKDSKIVIRYYSTNKKSLDNSDDGGGDKQDKEEKNGFDKNNKSYVFCGYEFSIPEYFSNPDESSKENSRSFYAEAGESTTMLNIACEELDCSLEIFDESKDQIMNNFVKSLEEQEITSSDEVDIAGCSGRHFIFDSKARDIKFSNDIYFFYSQDNKKLIFVGLAQSEKSKYDYGGDFKKIIDSIAKTDKPDDIFEASNVTETETITEETKVTTEEVTEATTEETDATTVTEITTEEETASDGESIYEYAYSRVYPDYIICYLIDTDAKECITYVSTDGYGYYGQYTGDLSSEIIVNYPREGYSDTITFQNGIGSDADVRVGDDTVTFEFKNVPVDSIEKYLKSINKDFSS